MGKCLSKIYRGICLSNKIHPIDKKNTKKIQEGLKNLQKESKYLLQYFTHDFFQNIHRYSNTHRNIYKWKTKILIFETTIQIIMLQEIKKKKIYIKRLQNIFENESIDECAYTTIQFYLVELLQESLGDICTFEIIESWNICCEEICKIIKLL